MRLRRRHLVLLAGIFSIQMMLNSSFLWCLVWNEDVGCGGDQDNEDPKDGDKLFALDGPYMAFPNQDKLPASQFNLTDTFENADHLEQPHNRWNISDLDLQMGDAWQWDWIHQRILHMWPEWVSAQLNLSSSLPFSKKKILVIPGLLSMTDFARPDVIAGGGPLGELVQWSDLIAALHVLGHQVELQHDTYQAELRLKELASDCQEFDPGCGCIDLIYTDYGGIRALSRHIRARFRNRFRVLDVYGTEAMFNDAGYARRHNIVDPPALGLNLKQFLTLYPMSPDNTFLGFAVPAKKLSSPKNKENIALLYGKDIRYIKDKLQYIWALRSHLDLYATMPGREDRQLKSIHVTNLGLVSNKIYQNIVTRAKVLVGLGNPIEGTGVMEALAAGTIFINPHFSGEQQNALRRKPTTRKVTSQVPYLEWYVGRPHVLTVNINNITEVIAEVKKAVEGDGEQQDPPPEKLSGVLPYEFSVKGYLQRLALHVYHQNFCAATMWPPKSSLRLRYSQPGQSCIDTCHLHGLVCEPALFLHINNVGSFPKDYQCSSTEEQQDIIFPAYNHKSGGGLCVLQGNPSLFSCAGADTLHARLCPCRNYLRAPHQQVALCKECL